MKKGLMLFIFLVFTPFVASGPLQDTFVLELSYDHGVIGKESLYVTPLYFSDKKDQPENGYAARLISTSNEGLYEVKFMFPLFVTDLPIQKLEKGKSTIYLPYNSNAEKIEIYSPERNKILSINVRQFIENVCGDGRCDELESYESCSLDCKKTSLTLIKDFRVIILGGIIVVILVILIIYMLRKKH